MATKKKNEEKGCLTEVYTGSLWQVQIVKGLLDTNGIECMIEDDTLSAVTAPYAGLGGDVKLLVNPQDAETAQKVIYENEKELVNCN